MNRLMKIRKEKLEELQAKGEDPFAVTKYNRTHNSQEVKENFDELEEKDVSIAGRIVGKRVMGRLLFAIFKICKEKYKAMLVLTI